METITEIAIGITLALIATFVIVGFGEPTHYCESRELKANCLDLSPTTKTCYTLPAKTGGKRCTEGWKEIPVLDTTTTIVESNNPNQKARYVCNKDNCIRGE